MLHAQERDDTLSILSLVSLTLTHFRCYDHLHIDVDSTPVVITGKNGAGKTNILEAISLLVPGRGLRQAKLSSLDYQGVSENVFSTNCWAISAAVNTPNGVITIGTGKDPDSDNEKRIVKIDGQKKRGQTSLSEHISLCYLTPQMDTVLQDGTTERRNYLDRLVSMFAPEHVKHLTIYDRSKSERRKLLAESHPDSQWLDVLEMRMAEHGIAIAAERIETLQHLQRALDIDDSPFPKALLSISGEIEEDLQAMPAVQVEEKFKQTLTHNRSVDAQTGMTHAGIHRSDFLVQHKEKGFVAEQCSTGEQKALLLAITLASVRAKAAWSNLVPILLLDEVVAHLDEQKREYLIAALEALKAQVWMTGTEVGFFAGFRGKAQFFALENSCIIA